MKNHLKRIAAPRTWVINRKERKYIVRPNPGAHSFDFGLPLGLLLRDAFKVAATMAEAKKLLHNNEILVDGKQRKNHRFIVGLFDVVTLPVLKKSFRIVLDNKGRVAVKEVSGTEAQQKLCKVVGKNVGKKGILHYHLHDGRTLNSDIKANVGDSLLITFPKIEVKETIALTPGNQVFLTRGKHGGAQGQLKTIKGKEATFTSDGKEVETAKAYLFVTGKTKPLITITL
ncbi:30S ribosomal protein S4e [Candidatus Woesearchaeota archaeon]|jgi:small subunit ribosomal protein S4e|nr:30S ribosomal protein S4e [Candidatus Woesearchaeota archaeon]MBT5739561.1 30S ribosomal protein S4e [Candidatus Woesearchaeota archaeon]